MKVELLNQGDIVRTPRGYFARVLTDSGEQVRVNWIGVSFSGLPTFNFRKSDIKIVKTETEDFFKSTFKQIEKEALRRVIAQERELRKASAPSAEMKLVRRRDNIKSMLKELSLKDSEALVEFIREKKLRLTRTNGGEI